MSRKIVLRITLLALAIVLPAIFIWTCTPANSPDSVFPGAEGFGTKTQAGRRGQIVKVTNLNDSGSGSLRHAVNVLEPRTIVFEVGGTIELSTDLVVDTPYVTIAGQTAPSPGITLKGAGLKIQSHDVLAQHLRVRVGDSLNGPDPEGRDGIQISGAETFNIVLDHISASWAIDENGSTWAGAHDITIRHSIFSESLHRSIHPKGAHGNGFLVGQGTRNLAMIGNLFAHNADRNPRVKGNSSVIILNNVMYNNKNNLVIGSDDGPALVSVVGNVFINGPDMTSGRRMIDVYPPSSSVGTKVFHHDNHFNVPEEEVWGFTTTFDPSVSEPVVWWTGLDVKTNDTVEAWVLANVGARPEDRDAIDSRVIGSVNNRGGRIIDSQTETGGWEISQPVRRPLILPEDPYNDDDRDGYTNLEEFLHSMSARIEGNSELTSKQH
jgi:hypothetical protein